MTDIRRLKKAVKEFEKDRERCIKNCNNSKRGAMQDMEYYQSKLFYHIGFLFVLLRKAIKMRGAGRKCKCGAMEESIASFDSIVGHYFPQPTGGHMGTKKQQIGGMIFLSLWMLFCLSICLVPLTIFFLVIFHTAVLFTHFLV